MVDSDIGQSDALFAGEMKSARPNFSDFSINEVSTRSFFLPSALNFEMQELPE